MEIEMGWEDERHLDCLQHGDVQMLSDSAFCVHLCKKLRVRVKTLFATWNYLSSLVSSE